MSFTEEEFLSVIADGNQSKMQIGALITLSNQYCSTYEVIGVNHDSTVDTVDIMAHIQAGDQMFDTNASRIYARYIESLIRTWINGTYFNAFSTNVKNAAKAMDVESYNYNSSGKATKLTTSDKVKLLSGTEIGIVNTTDCFSGDGSFYTGAFTSGAAGIAIMDRWRDAGSYGDDVCYWLRTPSTNYTMQIYRVNSTGTCVRANMTGTYGVLPVLRF